jgi:hypothetical protein
MSAHNQVIDVPQELLADVVIRAEVPMRMTSKNRAEIATAIAIGAGAAKRALPQIRRCIAGKSVRSGQMAVV